MRSPRLTPPRHEAPSRRGSPAALGAGLILVISTLSACPGNKAQFISMSYPDKVSKRPAPNRPLIMLAILGPKLVVAYRRPHDAGRCLKSIAAQDEAAGVSPGCIELPWRFGRCLHDPRETWRSCAKKQVWWLRLDGKGTPPDAHLPSCRVFSLPGCRDLHGRDKLRLARSLLDAGETLYTKRLATNGAVDSPLGESRGPARAIFRVAAKTLSHEAPRWPHRVEHPVLALSGGAANGAFTAGYLHALLSLRETAIKQCGALAPSPGYTQGTRGRSYATLAKLIEEEYRFGGAAGTSVGSLVAVLLDLYFTRPQGPLSQPLLGTLHHCMADAHRAGIGDGILPKVRPLQACALAKLRRELSTRNEWDLLCAEPGDILELIINRPNMLRFSPLFRRVVRPYLETFKDLLGANDFITVAMAVDIQQNVLVGVDERLCHAASIPTVDCLASGIQASISEPVFVPPVRRLFLGLHPHGQAGAWLDGGLHSGTPVARALGLAGDGVPILAINTNRAEGIPSGPPAQAFDAMFGTIDTMADKTRAWEIAYGQLQDEERRRELSTLRRLLFGQRHLKRRWRWSHRRQRWASQLPTPTPSGRASDGERAEDGKRKDGRIAPTTSPAARRGAHRPPRRRHPIGGRVAAIYVPAKIQPEELFAAGYTFDPLVMKGLFLYGQRTFLARRRALFEWLEWREMTTLAGRCRGYAKAVVALENDVRKRLDRYLLLNGRNLRAHRAARRKAVERHMQTCY